MLGDNEEAKPLFTTTPLHRLSLTLKLSVDIVDDGFPTVFFVDLISVADCVNDRQTETHVAFTKLVSVRLFDCVRGENKI